MKERRHGACGAAINDGRFMIVCGEDANGKYEGKDSTATSECYNAERREWSSIPSMRQIRFGACAVALRGDSIMILGSYNGKHVLNSVEIYSPDSLTWRDGPPMPSARDYACAACCGGGVFVIGGWVDGAYHRDCCRFDLSSSSWSTLPSSCDLSYVSDLCGCCAFVLA